MEDKSDLRTYAHHHSLYKLSAKVQKHKHLRNTHVQIFTYCPLKRAKFLRIAPSGASIFTQVYPQIISEYQDRQSNQQDRLPTYL